MNMSTYNEKKIIKNNMRILNNFFVQIVYVFRIEFNNQKYLDYNYTI